MKIIGMMRVKNEARWIKRVLHSMLPVCERILVFDDHSDDGTPYICSSVPGVSVFDSPFGGVDETRDKNYLLEKAAEHAPDWILHIDGDEELVAEDCAAVSALCARGEADVFRFRILYLWDRPDQIRVDRWYASFRRSSLFRFQPRARFQATGNGGNFHCGNVPAGEYSLLDTQVRILHYGYLHREDRIRKFEWYNRIDPNNGMEDGYRHMVVGDLYPPDSRFKWAGPLELQSLNPTMVSTQ